MNQRLTATGKKILWVSRQLSRLPQSAPVPRAFASLLSDPADLMEEAWGSVLLHSDAESSFTNEPISNAESANLKTPQNSFRHDVSLPQPRFHHRHGKTPAVRHQHIFENLASSAVDQSGVASASENVPPATLPDTSFRGATVQGTAGKFSLKPETIPLQPAFPKVSPSEAIFRRNLESGFGVQVSEEARAETARSFPEPLDSPRHTKDAKPHSTRLTRSSARLAAVLNANLRKHLEQEQLSEPVSMPSSPLSASASMPASPLSTPQSLSLVRSAVTSPEVITSVDADAPQPSGFIQSPAPILQIDHSLTPTAQDTALNQPLSETQPVMIQSLTIEAVLEELYQRLRVEFLRAYGSSGG